MSHYVNGSTAKECRDKARLLKSEYSAGVREIKKGVPTLTEAIDRYIEKRRNTLSPSTIDGYRRIQKNRFSSVMGLPLDAKTDWQAVCNAEAILCSPKTLRNAFRFIVSVLGENSINAPKVTLPPLNTNPRQWLEPEQIPKLIAAAVGTPSAFPVLLALHSLRRSELLAVTWDDIDLAAGTIRVSGAVVQNEDHHILKRISRKSKQKHNFEIKFACCFACCLLVIKKPLGSLRAALFISPMIFSLCPFRQRFRGTAFSARQTSQELRGALFRERFPFPSLRPFRRRSR